MSLLLTAQVASTAAYLGFQASVQVVVYRQFENVPTDVFVAYEHDHQRRISYVVGPLFAALIATTAALTVRPPSGRPIALIAASAVAVVVILAATALLAVPEHRRLSTGWDQTAYRRLLRADAIRIAAAFAAFVIAVAMAIY